MRRAILGLTAAALAGCGDGSPPKRELAKPIGDGPKPVVPRDKLSRPEKTDAAAADVVTKLLAAHTGGKPDRLAALKTYAVNRTGKLTEGDQTVDIAMSAAAAWPDRYRVDFRQGGPQAMPHVFAVRGDNGWQAKPVPGADAEPLGLISPVIMADVLVEWMILLVPLTEPAGWVAAAAPDESGGGKPAKAVRVWVGEKPWMHLVVDPESGRLREVRYEVTQFGGPVPKAMAIQGYTEVNGVSVPSRLEYSENGRPKTHWSSSVVEFPKATPDEKFDKP